MFKPNGDQLSNTSACHFILLIPGIKPKHNLKTLQEIQYFQDDQIKQDDTGLAWGRFNKHTKFWFEILKRRYHLDNIDEDRRIILKWIVRKLGGMVWTQDMDQLWAVVNTVMNMLQAFLQCRQRIASGYHLPRLLYSQIASWVDPRRRKSFCPVTN